MRIKKKNVECGGKGGEVNMNLLDPAVTSGNCCVNFRKRLVDF